MLRRSQALETPQLGFRELNGRKSSWTWPSSAPKPPRPGTFSGTFSGTLLNVTWLCTKASQTFSGTWLNLTRRLHQCTSAHRSYSGLKTPLAYAGEKQIRFWKVSSPQIWGVSINKTQYLAGEKGHFSHGSKIPEDENSVLILPKNYPHGYMYDIIYIYTVIYNIYIYIYILWYIMHIYI